MAWMWLNGRLLDAARPAIAADDRGLLLADGLFETIRFQRGEARQLARHLARLHAGAVLLDLPLPPARTLDDAVCETAAANRLREGALRLTATRGRGPRGIDVPERPRPTILITVNRRAAAASPVRVVVDARFRRDERSPLAGVKALGYLPSVLARREARVRGADDALLRNTADRIASATAATLLLWRRAGWITPPRADGALPGTARASLLEAGLVEEATVGRPALKAATAGLLVNALCMRPILAIEGRPLPWPGDARRSLPSLFDVLDLPPPSLPR